MQQDSPPQPSAVSLHPLCRKKNDPLDFVALLQQAEQPEFTKLPRKATKRKAPAKTLLPEDHHYKVGSYAAARTWSAASSALWCQHDTLNCPLGFDCMADLEAWVDKWGIRPLPNLWVSSWRL